MCGWRGLAGRRRDDSQPRKPFNACIEQSCARAREPAAPEEGPGGGSVRSRVILYACVSESCAVHARFNMAALGTQEPRVTGRVRYAYLIG